MHNKCNAHESSPHNPTQSVKKLSSMKMVPGARKVRDCYIKGLVSKIYRKQTQQDKKEFQTTQLENSWTVILPEGYTDSK